LAEMNQSVKPSGPGVSPGPAGRCSLEAAGGSRRAF